MNEIRIRGLDEFNRSVGRLVRDGPMIMREAGQGAAEMTVDAARPTVPVRTGAARRSLTSMATQTGGQAEGGEGIDYYAWLEHGGRAGRNLSVSRAIVPRGRYLWPAHVSRERAIVEFVEGKLERAVRSAGLDVTR